MNDILCPKCDDPINDHDDENGCLYNDGYYFCDCMLTPQDIAAHALEQAGLLTDTHGRTWRALEREDSSVSVYYTRKDNPTHFVVWDGLDHNHSAKQVIEPPTAVQTALAYGDADLEALDADWRDEMQTRGTPPYLTACPKCGGTKAHRVDCEDEIAF